MVLPAQRAAPAARRYGGARRASSSSLLLVVSALVALGGIGFAVGRATSSGQTDTSQSNVANAGQFPGPNASGAPRRLRRVGPRRCGRVDDRFGHSGERLGRLDHAQACEWPDRSGRHGLVDDVPRPVRGGHHGRNGGCQCHRSDGRGPGCRLERGHERRRQPRGSQRHQNRHGRDNHGEVAGTAGGGSGGSPVAFRVRPS